MCEGNYFSDYKGLRLHRNDSVYLEMARVYFAEIANVTRVSDFRFLERIKPVKQSTYLAVISHTMV